MLKQQNSKQLKEDLEVKIQLFNPLNIAKSILNDSLQKELIKLCMSSDEQLSSRAVWVFWHCYELDKSILKKYQDVLILNLKNINLHDGVKRNTLRLFQKNKIPQIHEAFMLDMCYSYIKNITEAIAVRAFAITVIYNISLPYPELLSELKATLQLINHPNETPGIKSRIINTIKNIDKKLK